MKKADKLALPKTVDLVTKANVALERRNEVLEAGMALLRTAAKRPTGPDSIFGQLDHEDASSFSCMEDASRVYVMIKDGMRDEVMALLYDDAKREHILRGAGLQYKDLDTAEAAYDAMAARLEDR